MAKRKKKATVAELIDWRIGHHLEAAASTIGAAFHRVADELARANKLHAEELEIRREHLLSVLESKVMADKAAQKIMGLMPDLGIRVHDLRESHDNARLPCGHTNRSLCGPECLTGPEWVKDVLEEH